MPEIDISKLKPNWLRFADLILQGIPQTTAALKTFPKVTTYKSASVIACRLLDNVRLNDYIEAKKAEISLKTQETITWNKVKSARRFEEIADRSLENKDLSNENRAIENLTKIIGGYNEDNAQKNSVADIFACVMNATIHQEQPTAMPTAMPSHELPLMGNEQPMLEIEAQNSTNEAINSTEQEESTPPGIKLDTGGGEADERV